MILDKQLVFSAAQALTTQGAVASTDIVDLTEAGDALDSLWLEVGVHTAAASDGNATLTVALQTSVDVAFTSPITLLTTAALAKTVLTKGAKLIQSRIPMGCKRYLRVLLTVGTADLTAGKFNAYLVSGIDKLS